MVVLQTEKAEQTTAVQPRLEVLYQDGSSSSDMEERASILHVIGEVNHCVEDVQCLLARKNSGEHALDMNHYAILFLGNYFCGDDGFLEMADYLLQLQRSGRKTIFLRGYNESLLVKHLRGELIQSEEFFDSQKLLLGLEEQLGYPVKQLIENRPDIVEFLYNTSLWYDNNNFIFCPGAINLEPSWKRTKPQDFFKLDNRMVTAKNKTGKKIIFGFYKSEQLNRSIGLKSRKHNNIMWQNKEQTKICLNGQPIRGVGNKVLGLFIDGSDTHPIFSRVGRAHKMSDELNDDGDF